MRVVAVALSFVLVALALAALWLWTPDRSRAELEAAYLRSPADLMDVAGVRLHVRDDGPRDAPAVIMLHGFGSSLHTFEAWAQGLQGRFRVIRFDLPGAGLSGSDPTGRYTDERSAEVLLALMDRLGVQQASLVGNSIGGRLAWTVAAAHPERTAKLVLISPDGFASPGFEYGARVEIPLLVRAMRYVLPRALVRPNLAAAYGDPARLTDATADRYYDLLLAPGVRSATIARMEQTVREDPVARFRSIAAPTLLLWGEKDALIPVRNAQDYLGTLPHAELVTLPALGHVPQEEAPAETLPVVRAFLLR